MSHPVALPETLPIAEAARIKKLRSYEISYSRNEPAFEKLAQLAADFFDVPFARIGFIDLDTVYLKVDLGSTGNRAIHIDESIDAQILSVTEVLSFEDLRNNLIAPAYAESYLAVPIKSDEGYTLGSVAIMGENPLKFEAKHTRFLKKISGLVMDLLESRLSMKKILKSYDNRLHMLIHDLKNPLTTISLQSELLSRLPEVPEKVILMATKINKQTSNTIDALNFILEPARDENGSVKLLKTKISVASILKQLLEDYRLQAAEKKQTIDLVIDRPDEIFGTEDRLYELFSNLLSNALKFSASGTQINIELKHIPEHILISVRDQGPGLSNEEMQKLFIKFADLPAVATGNERSSGIGLILSSMLVDLHKGRIWAESSGLHQGTTFFVELPLK